MKDNVHPSLVKPHSSDGIIGLIHLIRSMLADLLKLIAVEAKLFGYTALTMVALSLSIALLMVGGWLFAGVALVMVLANLSVFSLTGALLAVALLHLVLAALVFWRLVFITRDLTFRESRASMDNLLTHARTLVDRSLEE
ncbi:hypothetical protein SAMN02745752_00003 [Marinospirillum alkaliphilum DSM 21637]|uniref:Holin-X, holin superfamily III n=1 Tax=Marinospirillum alkaliphilum DSM 21637 TaxID=1122209 RepID=A0A1K1TAJ3_9GAMM|nr:hypothetical protein SAMN02745752_00003 [Marinospirillum alkaliphilum DSM 21637]